MPSHGQSLFHLFQRARFGDAWPQWQHRKPFAGHTLAELRYDWLMRIGHQRLAIWLSGALLAAQLACGSPPTSPISGGDAGFDGGASTRGFRAIDRGVYGRCVITHDEGVDCWSFLDGGSYSTGLTHVRALGMGFYVYYALHADGTVSTWSENAQAVSAAEPMPGVSNAIAISAACFVTAQKTVRCFNAPSIDIAGLANVTGVTSGTSHSCALTSDGRVKCWGQNNVGQLGDGTLVDSPAAVEVVGLSGVEAISSWYSFSCALLSDSTVKCWGSNVSGSLGNGSDAGSSAIPATVAGLSAVRAVSAGYHHACALLSDGHVKCWGRNSSGALGNGTNIDSSVPVDVVGVSDGAALAAGLSHSCVLTRQGGMTCWP